MAFDIGAFRTSFPEFADSIQYPDPTITMWGELAEMQVLSTIWKNAVTIGQRLFVAHHLVIWSQNQKIAASDGMPGTSGGIASSKSVGNASIQFDTQSTNYKDAAWWNLTTYGKQFFQMVRMFGAGAVQL